MFFSLSQELTVSKMFFKRAEGIIVQSMIP
jgi:hypothetical protein